MLDDSPSPACAASPDFELVHWDSAAAAPSFSNSLHKRSFRDVLAAAAATVTVTPLQQKEADVASFALLSLSLPLPPLMRDASTSTTPTSSAHSSEAADSDYEEDRFSWEDEDEQLELESLDFFPAHSDSSLSLLPLDLCSHCIEVDYDALEAEGASASVLLASPSAIDPSLAPRFRVRHRLMSHKPGSAKLVQYSRAYDKTRKTKDLHYYARSNKAGSGIAHLQKAAVKAPKTPATAAVVPAPPSLGARHNRLDPYYNQTIEARKLAQSLTPPMEAVRARSNGKKQGEAKAARKNAHAQRRSLAAPTRPALTNASPSFRHVLLDRAARKTQLVQAAASGPLRLPKHLRPHSSKGGVSMKQHRAANPAAVAAAPLTQARSQAAEAKTVRMAGACDFDSFRYLFWQRYAPLIQTAMPGAVAGVRLAPMGQEARQRFMDRMQSLASSDSDIPLVYHGTRLANMDSICRRGLLVPGRGNGVTVAHGSALGVGIYTCQEASYPYGFASPTTSTIFVCAALTKGAKGPSAETHNALSGAVVSGNVVVLMDEARVCPLFLLDIEDNPQSYARPLPPPGEAPFVRVKTVRKLLARAHALLRTACASNSLVTLRELDGRLFQ